MHIIIGMPPHDIIMGMPVPIMAIMRWQAAMNISFEVPSIGIISQTMPISVILQVIIAIMTGIGMPPMPIIGIMPFIMGIMPIIGFIIIGFIIIGIIEPIMPIMGIADFISLTAAIAIPFCVERWSWRAITRAETIAVEPVRI